LHKFASTKIDNTLRQKINNSYKNKVNKNVI